MNLAINKPDTVGITASTLCLVHCLATPFLFAMNTQTASLGSWWSSIDLVFLLIAALAIYKSSITITKKWISNLLWVSWAILLFIIVNEKIELLPIPEAVIYVPSVSLILLHFYSRKYCQCATAKCCIK